MQPHSLALLESPQHLSQALLALHATAGSVRKLRIRRLDFKPKIPRATPENLIVMNQNRPKAKAAIKYGIALFQNAIHQWR